MTQDESPNSETPFPFDPQLSVILFRRQDMTLEQMSYWAEGHRRSGTLLCLPTKWCGKPVFRLCIVKPATDPEHVLSVLRSMS